MECEHCGREITEENDLDSLGYCNGCLCDGDSIFESQRDDEAMDSL